MHCNANADHCLLETWEQIAMIFEPSTTIFTEENQFEYSLCKMEIILSRPQCVNTLRYIEDETKNAIFQQIFLWELYFVSLSFEL